MKYKIKFTTKFKKDLKLAKKRGKNLDELFSIVGKLANAEKLPEKCKDHKLKNTKREIRDCHIEPDWVLLYEIINEKLVLVFLRTGSHSDLKL